MLTSGEVSICGLNVGTGICFATQRAVAGMSCMRPVAPDWTAFQPAAGDFERVHANAGIERALALYRLGLDTEAFREWTAAIRGFDDRTLLAAAEVARQANVSDRAINTADRTIDSHVKSLRRKVAEAGGNPALLETVRGVGYRVTDEPPESE